MKKQVKNLAIVLDSQKVKVYSFQSIEQANSFKKAMEIPTGGMILVTRGIEGLRSLAGSFLVELHNRVTTESPVKKFANKETALRRVYEALTLKAEEKTMEKGTNQGDNETTPKKERKLSYHDKIRAYFQENDTATVDEIMTITGADKRNAKVAMGIIQNAKRVKNPMKFDYVKSTQTYYLLADGFGRKGQTEVPFQEEAGKKKKTASPTPTVNEPPEGSETMGGSEIQANL